MRLELMRDAAKVMHPIDAPESYDSARIWHCKYQSIAPLAKLTGLRALSVATFPDASLSFLTSLQNLEWLSLLHFPKITDLEPLSKLKSLKFLSLSTLPSWDSSGRQTVVHSFEPIKRLTKLEHISLLGVVVPEKSLALLESCRSLTSAKFHGVSSTEKERFFAASGIIDKHMPEPFFGSWPPA